MSTKLSDFPYKVSFDGLTIKASIASEYDKYLATASIKNLSSFLPQIDLEKNVDILAISFDAFVACKANKNGQVIDGEHALQVAPLFVNKYINVEHLRKNVIGFVTNYGFSEFGSSNPISEENANKLAKNNIPFNIALSGVIWRFINESIVEELEESSDPSSLKYMSISASWELAFREFNIIRGSKNIAEAEIISDKKIIEELKNSLTVFGGNGIDKDGIPIYTNLIGDSLLGLGIGITNTPAAEVKGILTAKDLVAKENDEKKLNKYNDLSVIKDMEIEIKNIEDITDESLKTITASKLTKFIETSLEKSSEEWTSKLKQEQDSKKELEKSLASLVEKLSIFEKENLNLKKSLDEIKETVEAKELQDKFQSRMSLIDDKYELDKEFSKIIAEELKTIVSDEDFNTWFKKFSILAKDRSKEAIKARNIIKANEGKENISEIIEKANIEKVVIPNTVETASQTLAQRMQSAFSLKSIKIKIN